MRMLRVPLVCLGLIAVAWLEFAVFPGHSYLQGETQIYLPLVERIDTPGLLSRDLVVANGSLSLTVYDEATLFLHSGGRLPLRRALTDQQWIFRIAALLGVFLLAKAAGLGDMLALSVAAIVNLGGYLAGAAASLAEREPLPGGFAFSLSLLAMGLLSRRHSLLAAMAGGLAFLYDPFLAAPFWLACFAAFVFDRNLRRLIRPMLPVFAVFALLLANLAQLQPGGAAEPPLTALPHALSLFQRAYLHNLYVSEWPSGELLQLAALGVLALWAAVRCRRALSAALRWIVLGTASLGVLSIPVSYCLLDRAGLAWIARIQPTRSLLYLLAASAFLFAVAGARAALRARFGEAFAWFLLLFSIPASEGVFDFVRLTDTAHTARFALAVSLAALLTLAVCFSRAARLAPLVAPAAAAFALAITPSLNPAAIPLESSVADLADWASTATWGSSLFLFPDAGKATDPDVFRAQARRGLWVDWESRHGVAFSESAAALWQERWGGAMQGGFSTARLERLLPLPIDYYVLRASNRLAGLRYAYRNRDFIVYDAEDLRNAPSPLARASK